MMPRRRAGPTGPLCGPPRAALRLASIGLIFVVASACHATPKPSSLPPLPDSPARAALPTSAPLFTLVNEIDGILAAPALERSYWSVLVRSLKSDEVLYARNARKLMMPASNMKIVTLAAAAERLGWDYRYETKILETGPIDSGTLEGDLVV